MAYSDPGHAAAEEEIRKLSKRLHVAYTRAYKEMQKRAKADLARQTKADAEMVARVEAGDMTEEQLRTWRRGRAADATWYARMVDQLARDMAQCDRQAAAIVNGTSPAVYAENANYGAFQVESVTGTDTSWTLVDADTVAGLVRDNPDLLPRVDPNQSRAERWARRKITSAITQSVLVGDSVQAASRRIRSVVEMDERAAIRAARTALTGAENAGRVSSYDRARGMGIDVRARWMATLDSRTRDSHRQLDGEVAGEDGRFSNGLRYPGDPQGPAAEVWNCRCTLVASMPGYDALEDRNTTKLETSYEDWKAGRDPRSKVPSGRSLKEFMNTPATKSAIEHAGISSARARRLIAEELAKEGKTGGDFRKLTRSEQRGIMSRVLGKLHPGAKRPTDEQPALKEFRYKGPGFMATEKSLTAVNPHLADGYKWQNNCQRCVVAWELRQRGYDVTAMPFAAHDGIGYDGTKCWKLDAPNWFNDSETRLFGGSCKGIEQGIKDEFEKWGDGSRAIIRVGWDSSHGGGGHLFSARREGNRIIYEDPQSGTVRDIDDTLAKCSPLYGDTWIMRVDDRELTDLVREAVENA